MLSLTSPSLRARLATAFDGRTGGRESTPGHAERVADVQPATLMATAVVAPVAVGRIRANIDAPAGVRAGHTPAVSAAADELDAVQHRLDTAMDAELGAAERAGSPHATDSARPRTHLEVAIRSLRRLDEAVVELAVDMGAHQDTATSAVGSAATRAGATPDHAGRRG